MKNFLQRTLSGAGFVVIVAAALLLNEYTFGILMLLLMIAMMVEFYRMTMEKEYLFSQILAIFAGVILFLLTYLFKGFHFPGRLVILAIVPIFIVMINSLYVRDKTDFGKFANLYTGLLYISVPVSLTNFAVFHGNTGFNGILLLSFFIIIWASDVGGYLFGITLGKVFKKKLFPEISPKKSWAGFWGGMFLSSIAGVILHYVGMLSYPLIHCIILAILMDVTGVYGDLIESQWKRYYAVKDSGNIMPGHGGMLDRLDSALIAIPVGVIYLLVVNIL